MSIEFKMYNKRYALAQIPDITKPMLVRLSYKNDTINATIQNTQTTTNPNTYPILESDIVCLFINDPPFGQAYGVKIEPHVQSSRLKYWGVLHSFRKLAKSEEQLIQNGFDLAYEKTVKRLKLKMLLPMSFEIRNNKGSMAGYYRPPGKDEGATPTICLCPKSFVELGKKDIAGLITHELGHPLWDNYVSDKYKAKWVKLYHNANKLEEIKPDEIKSLLKDFEASGAIPSLYRKDLEEKHQQTFDIILDWISSYHHLAVRFLDILVSQGNSLKNMWPHTDLHMSELEVKVTEYSNKNSVELFCETLRFYGMGETLPVSHDKLMKFTLKNIAGGE